MALIIAVIIVALVIVVSCHHSCPRTALCWHCSYAPTLLRTSSWIGSCSCHIPLPPSLLLYPEGLWQVVIGVWWYKNLNFDSGWWGCASVAEHSSLFGQVYLAATRWPDSWMDDRVSNCQFFNELVCFKIWKGLDYALRYCAGCFRCCLDEEKLRGSKLSQLVRWHVICHRYGVLHFKLGRERW